MRTSIAIQTTHVQCHIMGEEAKVVLCPSHQSKQLLAVGKLALEAHEVLDDPAHHFEYDTVKRDVDFKSFDLVGTRLGIYSVQYA